MMTLATLGRFAAQFSASCAGVRRCEGHRAEREPADAQAGAAEGVVLIE
jgi:hypothetical protein